jgi:hypothetical protein
MFSVQGFLLRSALTAEKAGLQIALPAVIGQSRLLRIPVLLQSHSKKPQEALKLLVTEERYWALFYMPL